MQWELKLLVAALFATSASFGPFFSLFMQDKGFDALQIGTMISLSRIVMLLSTPATCAYADRRGCHRGLLACLALTAAGVILMFPLAPKGDFLIVALIFASYSCCSGSKLAICDTIVLHGCKGVADRYPLQRLWGSVAWGIVSLVIGFVIRRYHADKIANGLQVTYEIVPIIHAFFQVCFAAVLLVFISPTTGGGHAPLRQAPAPSVVLPKNMSTVVLEASLTEQPQPLTTVAPAPLHVVEKQQSSPETISIPIASGSMATPSVPSVQFSLQPTDQQEDPPTIIVNNAPKTMSVGRKGPSHRKTHSGGAEEQQSNVNNNALSMLQSGDVLGPLTPVGCSAGPPFSSWPSNSRILAPLVNSPLGPAVMRVFPSTSTLLSSSGPNNQGLIANCCPSLAQADWQQFLASCRHTLSGMWVELTNYSRLARDRRVFFPIVLGASLLSLAEVAMNNFLFTYLRRELFAPPELFSYVLAIHSLSEVVAFKTSSHFVVMIGPKRMMMISALAFATKATWYTVLKDPWTLLYVEGLHGLCFAMMWSAAVAHVSRIADILVTASSVSSVEPGNLAPSLDDTQSVEVGLQLAEENEKRQADDDKRKKTINSVRTASMAMTTLWFFANGLPNILGGIVSGLIVQTASHKEIALFQITSLMAIIVCILFWIYGLMGCFV